MKRKPIGLYVAIFVAIFLAALVIMGFMVKSRIGVITREAQRIAAMDIDNDTVDSNVYSGGRYAFVEATMKNYINDYLSELRKFDMVYNDEKLGSLLGAANIQSDGPYFENSKEYIEKVRGHIDTVKANLKDMAKEENVLDAFYSKGLNFFFNWIYRKQMLDVITLNFYYNDASIDNIADAVYTDLNKKEAVLDFLSANAGSWEMVDGMIQFESDELLAEYQRLVSEV